MKNKVREYREYKGVSLRWLAGKVGCGTRAYQTSASPFGSRLRWARRWSNCGGKTMTDEQWRTYLRREIKRLLILADTRTMELTLEFLRVAA